MTYVVALTGGVGSGKSTVADAFLQLGVPIVDADFIARQVTLPGTHALEQIVQRHGPTILQADGTLNRSRLRETIFSDDAEKQWLNNLLHPLIQTETLRQLGNIHAPYGLWVIPLLIEKNLKQQANRVLVVDVPQHIQISRTVKRDDVSRHQVEKIIVSQVDRERRLALADDIIDNSGKPDDIRSTVTALHQQYLALAAKFQ